MITRRQFLRRALATAGAASGLTGCYAWGVEPHWLELTRHRLPIRRLPADLTGRTLVQLSDMHVGPDVDDAYLVRTFTRVRALAPDFVVFTGDFITYWLGPHLDRLRANLAHFPHGRLGTFAVLGNHDYGIGWSHPEIAAQIAAVAVAAGIHVLRNRSVTAAGLQIVGLDDMWGRGFSPHEAFAEANPAAPTLVLVHNPDTVDRPGWPPYTDWILAGHTHGGQCKPPFLPPPLLPVENRRYTAGPFALSGGRSLYINRGVGYFLRLRFNVRPEVTVFRLERA